MSHVRQEHQGTLVVEGKTTYSFTLADGRHVHGHDFLHGQWAWRDGCDRAIPKILTGRESNILPYKSNLYKLSGKDVNVAGLAILSSSTC